MRLRSEDLKFKVIMGYTVSSRPAWDALEKRDKGKKKGREGGKEGGKAESLSLSETH